MHKLWYFFLALLTLHAVANVALADSREAGRLAMGVKLFRATLAADLALAEKKGPDGRLLLLVFADDDREGAQKFADTLAQGGPIRDIPIQVRIGDQKDLRGAEGPIPAGIFIAQSSLSEHGLQALVGFGRRHHRIVYSPFEGHVEQGVTAGLYITARVQPFVNDRSLEESRIQMKAFFLKVAKHHPGDE